ncbi:MAG TPA: FAD-dependent monooxygenase [Ktedonobacteraceae bacterium]|nr:FAD-dependent monooxygenase [Ktedonobacteraceae bacterium]
MQSQDKLKAIIIGGGIGGITTAIALRQAGIDAAVYERAPELREVGSGLPLFTNALKALQKLGLGDEIEALGAHANTLSVSTWQGRVLTDVTNEKHLQSLGTVSTVVHRAELLALLVETLGMENVHLNAECTGFSQDESGVRARFVDDMEAQGDFLVGADGLHSTIRSQMSGIIKPTYAGYTTWRGVAHIERSGLERYVWGKGYQFGIAPMSRGRAYWFAQKYTPEGQPDKAAGRKQELLDLFHDWHDPVPAVIEATRDADILRNDVYELPHLKHWSSGRVTLLGDAAHAMTPNLGQGGCLAIEDALVLADCLVKERDIVAALKLYETRRIKRTRNVARLAHLMAGAVQIENNTLAATRNAIFRCVPPSFVVKRVLWILDYKV